MSDLDSKSYGGAPKAEGAISQVEHAANLDEKAHISDFKADAMEAEEAEHKMGVIEAVKAYPMASFWAFVMSFTIVSPVLLLPKISQLIPCLDYGILRCLPHR
jgi:SP family general alpha glucoside:H+ symporter-like MFS transporter